MTSSNKTEKGLPRAGALSSHFHGIMKKPWKRPVLTFLAILVPSIIFLLVFSPGFLQRDHQYTISYMMVGHPSAWHSMVWGLLSYPLLVTSGSIIWYGVAQSILFSSIASFSVLRLRSLGLVSNHSSFVLTLLFAVWPSYSLYNLLYGTDTVFATMMIAVVTLLAEAMTTKGECAKRWTWDIGLGTALVVMFCMRKPMMSVAMGALVLLVVWLVLRGKSNLVLCVVGLSVIASTAITTMVDATTGSIASPMQEALGVPTNQMARALKDGWAPDKNDTACLEESKSLETWKEKYAPPLASNSMDNVRLSSCFMTAWWHGFVSHPSSYFSAWFDMMYPYWQFSINSNDSQNLEDVHQDFIISITDKGRTRFIPTEVCGRRNNSEWGELTQYISEEAPFNTCQQSFIDEISAPASPQSVMLARLQATVDDTHAPVVTDVFNIFVWGRALPFWTVIGLLALCIRRKDYSLMIPTSPVIALMLTLFVASPSASFRYVLGAAWVIPLLAAIALSWRRKKTNSPIDSSQ